MAGYGRRGGSHAEQRIEECNDAVAFGSLDDPRRHGHPAEAENHTGSGRADHLPAGTRGRQALPIHAQTCLRPRSPNEICG